MKSQLAIATLTVAALTACGSGSQVGTPPEPTTPTTLSTSLPPQPDTVPTASSTATTPVDTTTSTTPITTSTPVTTDAATGPVVGMRLDGDAAVFGVAVLQEVDVQTTIDAMSDALGDPTAMTEWAPMTGPLAAVGVQDYREVWWSDLRVVFERTDDVTRLSSWSLGETTTTGCFPPATTEPQGASNVTTADGIGIGSGIEVVSDHYFLVNQSTDGATIANVNPISLAFGNGEVSGVSQSRADCFADNEDM